ncbi:hypothetical protein M2451_003988 [Dysgonomonas sp. PFB1-18]|uniref:hypothetical protein n=1 Tax=unclassified Dysgonomonas TaxID=2630389 RepID=UPI0024757FC8|nr:MULTISPECIES: hypothetical protein [unclassified Dysgonomonas]MDH6311143.1 hypothetical protein [Dysgonomonas sp. PF1-14]MDH6341003.1 hypothetical protein [Dysgonomonas sp. PF1-16]MDH6382643.1 hypothetical protein [Dysgonomonas sp. PFB1-18]MDH6400008.1 hypothetical protein [Dysgonomonas sp. PF1-23]
MKKILISIILLLAAGLPVQAQVTVGGDTPPQDFSVLEILSNEKGGLRLPQLTAEERQTLEDSDEFQAEKTGLALGLTIFNMTTDCMETWNGAQWISLCGGPTINLSCGTASMSVISGVKVTKDNTFSIPYSGMKGGSIVLTDNQPLGTATNGLTIVANGAQTLNEGTGTINIKVTGTPTATSVKDNIDVSYTIANQTCIVVVTIYKCPGYMAVGGEYTVLPSALDAKGYLSYATREQTFSQISPKFKATGKDVCFYKTDVLNSSGTSALQIWAPVKGGCANGYQGANSYIDAEHRSMGWRVPTIVELGALQSIHSTLSTQDISAPGTVNLHSNFYWSSNESSSTVKWTWDYAFHFAYRFDRAGNYYTRCVKTF